MKKNSMLRLYLLAPAVLLGATFVILAKTLSDALGPDDSLANHNDTSPREELVYDHELPFMESLAIHEPEWQTYRVMAGDSFDRIAASLLGLTAGDVAHLAMIAEPDFDLARLSIGLVLEYLMDSQGRLQALKFHVKADRSYLLARHDCGFIGHWLTRTATRIYRVCQGRVARSLNHSLCSQGLSATLASTVGGLLEKKHNLRRDLREGDYFMVLVAVDEVDGNLFSTSIEAVRLDGQRVKAEAYRHTDGYYYDPDGHSLDPAFNRYPFTGAHRISSPFSLRRRHPVTGAFQPHYGTDFAARTGTAVIAPADGLVKRAGYHQYAGHYLVIEHFNGLLTRYFHLSKILVRPGARIERGMKIALTGNSGRSTGAHLHYELHKNGRPIDAMRAVLPERRRLEGGDLVAFQMRMSQQAALLDQSDYALSGDGGEAEPQDGQIAGQVTGQITEQGDKSEAEGDALNASQAGSGHQDVKGINPGGQKEQPPRVDQLL